MQRRHLLIGALVALPILAIGGVSAFAASGGASGTSPAATFIADVASHLGISTSTLQNALEQARLDQVQQMLSSGKITQAQATKMEAAIKSGKMGPGFGGMHRPGGGMMRDARGAMQAAATYLGLTAQQLQSQLQAGKSLSDIASATSGKTVQGLEAAITAAMQQDLQQAVTQGRLTQQQATNMQASLQTFVQRFVTRVGGGHGRGGPWGPPTNGLQPGGAPSSD